MTEVLADLDRLRLETNPAVLILEDDTAVANALTELLSVARPETRSHPESKAWDVTCAATIREAREAIKHRLFDFQIIDRKLPDGEGLNFVKWQRADGVRTPILVLTNDNTTKDRVFGFKHLVDHYIGKPYDSDELLAVVRAATWRYEHDGLLARGKLEIKFTGRGTAFYAGKELTFVREMELRILALLAIRDPENVTREMLHEFVWGFPRDSRTHRLVEPDGDRIGPRLNGLRENLKKHDVPANIVVNVPGQGWKLDAGLLQRGSD
jgi:DNA-binding response OmpR family regulator